MRESKFRAKIKGDAGVYKVWIIDWLNQRAFVERACGDEWVAFDKIERFLEYTGIKDKNEVEVYESDIIQGLKINIYTLPCRAIVQWNTELATWDICYPPDYGTPINKTGTQTHLLQTMIQDASAKRELEVIGNIYENPELLGGSNNQPEPK